MKWKSFSKRREERTSEKYVWRFWFAWYPVFVRHTPTDLSPHYLDHWVWLECVYTRIETVKWSRPNMYDKDITMHEEEYRWVYKMENTPV